MFLFGLSAVLHSDCTAIQVGEFATIVATSSSDTQIVLAIFQLWLDKNSFEVRK
jgi:hypothetical protein